MGKGSGYGKVILFGEHFVVHGIPGIVSAIGATTEAEVKKAVKGLNIKDERKTAKGYSEEKRLQQIESVERMLKTMGINPKIGLDIWIGGSLPGFSGLGASAASSVAIARAINEELSLNLSIEKINAIAYEAEKAYAGNPSGIDNTAAEKIHVHKPIEIVIGSTGKVANTKAMVEGVADRKKKNSVKYDQLFKQAESLAVAGRKALEGGDLKKVGDLMNENHRILQELGVSSKELDQLVDIARKQGAFGAKLTGGGGGGCMVALTPGKEVQGKVVSAFKGAGYEYLMTRIGIGT
jgi:mevalonate kinase